MTELEEKVARLACWKDPVELAPLKGGLTNISFVVTHRGEKFVARCGEDIPGPSRLPRPRAGGVDGGVRGRPVARDRSCRAGITVLRFIEGRTFGEADLRANVGRLAALLKDCHTKVGRHLRGPANTFWVFHVIRDYVRLIDADPRYLAVADRLEQAQVPLPIVFGHHDLLPGNFMDDGKRLWLIDWEYGGFGTAMFDLANLSSNGEFDAAEDDALLDAYFAGKADATLRQSFAAMKAASALREALWAMVSDVHLKTPGVDYKAHAKDYLARFEKLMPA